MLGTCTALPQRRPVPSEQVDYPQAAPIQDQYQAPVARQQHLEERRESTTYIPIIRFDKEQGEDGSYKAA